MSECPQPFRTQHEDGCVPGFGDGKPAAALMICADASPLAIAGAALARASTLRASLLAWASIGGKSSIDASEVAQTLEPAAHEVDLLLSALVAQLGRAEQARQSG